MKRVFVIEGSCKSHRGITTYLTAVVENEADANAYCEFHERKAKERGEQAMFDYQEVLLYDTGMINILRESE